ncbi:hypothetical protein Pcinc_026593 [Petrolisthes cinctipes]|uniref:Uncharacterized protein n=1 Tax=Petrolisthes cinctipes TaxID=88211 RepID=A0AAE1F6D2_PETCI|nr:hypothetical protein Pcinc_026593 [Petrolisthes cinctipes]
MAATRTRNHAICNPSTSTLSPLHPRCMSDCLVRRHKKLRLWKYLREAGLVNTMSSTSISLSDVDLQDVRHRPRPIFMQIFVASRGFSSCHSYHNSKYFKT